MVHSAAAFQFLLNGKPVEVRGLDSQTTLLDFIRDRGLTGAKEGCAEGECGACTVALRKSGGYTAVNSCLVFLPSMAGQEVYTVESLRCAGQLHPVQQAMVETGGSQCGYCTPGFVMSLFAEYYRPGRVGAPDSQALEGNLCRCTGYRPIRDSAALLGPARDDAFRSRLAEPAPGDSPIRYQSSRARFSRPASMAECLDILAREPEALPLAGGTDLAVQSNLQNRRFPHLVSVEGLSELRVFADRHDAVEIGAALTLQEIEQRWVSAPPVFREWLRAFASPLIRNRATLGGNLATASPIGDAAPMLLAMNAQVNIANASGTRMVPLHDFFTFYRRTVLASGDMLVSIVIPKPLPTTVRFYKVAKRRLDDISTVAACFALDLDGAGRVNSARFAYGGVAAIPKRVMEAEDAVLGRVWDQAAVQRSQDRIQRALTPLSDHRGSSAYRLAMASSLLEKFWHEENEAVS